MIFCLSGLFAPGKKNHEPARNAGSPIPFHLHPVTPFPRFGFWLFLLVVLTTVSVHAEPLPTGDNSGAMPGIERVVLPGIDSPRLSLAATSGYGLTEAQQGQDGSNHRLAGTLAIGAAPLPWLEGALRLDGRYDKHPDDAEGSDDGLVGDPRIELRFGNRAGDLVYGADATAWFIGGDAPSVVLDATTVDLKALIGYAPIERGPTIALNAGWRFDQSANSVDRADTLRLGDRVGLGLSDSNALLLGVGVRQPVGKTEILGEVTGDLLIGADAPPVAQSPIRATAGARYWLSRRLAFSGLAEVVLSSRPDLGPTDPLVPIEPRVSVHVGLRYRIGLKAETEPQAQPVQPTPPPPSAEADQPEEQPETLPPPTPEVHEIKGRIVDEAGQPVPDAAVALKFGETAQECRTDAHGSFQFEVQQRGSGQVSVESPGLDRVTMNVSVGDAAAELGGITLRPAVPAGELRGLVRGLDGEPVPAEIVVGGTEIALETDAQGRFSVEVPPGSYVVEIKADGFVGQRRRVTIENRGVTVLNADIRKKQ